MASPCCEGALSQPRPQLLPPVLSLGPNCPPGRPCAHKKQTPAPPDPQLLTPGRSQLPVSTYNQLLALSSPAFVPILCLPSHSHYCRQSVGPLSTCLHGHPTGSVGSCPAVVSGPLHLPSAAPPLPQAGLACPPGHRSVLSSSAPGWAPPSASREGVTRALLCLPYPPGHAHLSPSSRTPRLGLLPLRGGPACDPRRLGSGSASALLQ